jgi:hypothetical protein
LPGGTIDTIKIVRIDYREVGLDNYTIVFFTFHADYPPLYAKIMSAAEMTVLENSRKGILLLKFDLFKGEWMPGGAMDAANSNQEFRFNNVQNKILQLSRGQ